MKKEKITYRHVIVCDIGNYGAIYCGHCNYKLDEDKYYKNCPDCGYKFIGSIIGGDFGGSDF